MSETFDGYYDNRVASQAEIDRLRAALAAKERECESWHEQANVASRNCVKAMNDNAALRALCGEVVSILRGVLCDPENHVCISGTEEDRRLITESLNRLDGVNQKGAL
jgi:hypothetical protein